MALAILHEMLRQDDIDRHCPAAGARRSSRESRTATALLERAPLRDGFVNIPMSEVKDLLLGRQEVGLRQHVRHQNLVDVEKRLSGTVRYTIDGVGVDRELAGQLDALLVEGEWDDHAIVLDWKDTWGLPPPTEVSFQGYFQQRFYAWLVMQELPLGRAGDAARVLRAPLGAPRGDDLARVDRRH